MWVHVLLRVPFHLGLSGNHKESCGLCAPVVLVSIDKTHCKTWDSVTQETKDNSDASVWASNSFPDPDASSPFEPSPPAANQLPHAPNWQSTDLSRRSNLGYAL